MAAMSAAAFAAVFWGTVALVLLVFVYELYAITVDLGWI